MLDFDETIVAFHRGVLDFDCKRMVLSQNKEGGARFEGQGYVQQSPGSALIFKIYVTQHNTEPFSDLRDRQGVMSGKIYRDEVLYNLDLTARDGTPWTATDILPALQWDAIDGSVVAKGELNSIATEVEMRQPQHCLRLHFFEEYDVPLHRMSETEKYGNRYHVRDLAQFGACGLKFEVRKREGSSDTVVEIISENAFPAAFDLRVQEALQYITAKTAIWRARLHCQNERLQLELASPWPKSARTQFYPPLSPGSPHFLKHGWSLFEKYLAYVSANTKDTHWNPVAYHLNNACEATANSLDARAVSSSVAVEALVGLISLENVGDKADQVKELQERMLKWLEEQMDFEEFLPRAQGLIKAIGNRRPQDVLYSLADTGYVDKEYVKAWTYLRNRHVHPQLKDLKKPELDDSQKLLDHVHRVEVLLRQLTFYLIGYEGPFTDYGREGFPIKQYPLRAEAEGWLVSST